MYCVPQDNDDANEKQELIKYGCFPRIKEDVKGQQILEQLSCDTQL